jgi:hypothetical protein
MRSALYFTLLASITISVPALALGVEGMSSMPIQKDKKEYVIQNAEEGEKLLEDRGYGDREPEVRMMNLMMVEGSGFEGMDMATMSKSDLKTVDAHSGHGSHSGGPITAADSSPEATKKTIEIQSAPVAAKVGVNLYQISILDPNTSKPATKVKVTAEVYMTSMDMGTETPTVKEVKPGIYEVKANFAMAGPWAIKIKTPQAERIFNVQVSK